MTATSSHPALPDNAIPCHSCRNRAANPDGRFRDLLTGLEIGHDHTAHLIYLELARRHVTPGMLADLTDEQILGWPGIGAAVLRRIRSVVPAPYSGCLYCDVLSGRRPGRIVHTWPNAAVLAPGRPVTPGHLLVTSRRHTGALDDPELTGRIVGRAVEYARIHAAPGAPWSTAAAPAYLDLVAPTGPTCAAWAEHLHIHLVPRAEHLDRRALDTAAETIAPPHPQDPEEHPTVPCPTCTRHIDMGGEYGEGWRALRAALRLGHDAVAHRTYRSLLLRGITPEQLPALTDADILDLRNAGSLTLAALRARLRAPGPGTVQRTPDAWLDHYALTSTTPAHWRRDPATDWDRPVYLDRFWELYTNAPAQAGGPEPETARACRD